MSNLKVNDKVKVRIYGADGKVIKVRNFDDVFTICEKSGNLGIYWNDEFTPLENFCNTKFLKQIDNLEIYGKRWFQKSYGNTYHSVNVYVNDELLRCDFAYGYGSQYLQTACDLLIDAGYDVQTYYTDGSPKDNYCSLLDILRNNDNFTEKVTDVKRKKDL